MSFKWFRGVESIEGLDSPKLIFDEMKSIVISSKETPTVSMNLKNVFETTFRSKIYRKNFFTGAALIVFLAFTGSTIITFYAFNIFSR